MRVLTDNMFLNMPVKYIGATSSTDGLMLGNKLLIIAWEGIYDYLLFEQLLLTRKKLFTGSFKQKIQKWTLVSICYSTDDIFHLPYLRLPFQPLDSGCDDSCR